MRKKDPWGEPERVNGSITKQGWLAWEERRYAWIRDKCPDPRMKELFGSKPQKRSPAPTKTWDEVLRGPQMSDVTGKTIFKYQMPVSEKFTMELPKGAEIIRVADQGGMFWLWAIVDTNAEIAKREFRAIKTGAPMPEKRDLKYLGFCAIHVQMELGLYIFEDRGPLTLVQWVV